MRKELLEHCINRRDGKQVCVDASDYRRWADWLGKQENKTDETTTAVKPAPEDNVITIDIANAKPASMGDLAAIIYHATTAAFVHIKGLFNSAKELNISCISFVCTCKPVEEVVDELVHSGFVINQNATKCLRLEEFMGTSLSKSSSTRI